ncbi:MAG: hypothetical protein CVV27_08080, partial [Candidatus Melainabacteria bacterium HGW-Melainabacteria-1]
LQTVARQTGEYEAAIAELERLGQQRQEVVTRREQHTQESGKVDQALTRLDGDLSSEDEALFQDLDPGLRFERGEDGRMRILRDGQEVTRDQLRTELQQKRQTLETQIAEDNHQIEETDRQIVAKRQEAAHRQAALQQSIAEAEQAFQQMSPEEQALYGDMHRSTLQQAQQALAEGARVLERLDAEFAHIPGYAEACQAPSLIAAGGAEAVAAADALEAESVLAAAPELAGAASEHQEAVARQERQSLEAAHRDLARSSVERTELKQQAESHFLNRIFEMRRELAEHETERRAHQQEAIERDSRKLNSGNP